MVVASKQVGDVYYMCESLVALKLILQSGEIKMSSKKEKSIKINKPEYFTSLTRNFKPLVAQKPARWRDGIILDGNKLSENYSIDAYSFSGWNMENQTKASGKFKISQITRWPSRCMVKFIGWSKEIQISFDAYEDIRRVCLTEIPESYQKKCRLEVSHGKRKRNGEIFIERLKFNTPGGSPSNIFQYMKDSTRSELAQVTNQYEERIHGPQSTSEGGKRFRSTQADSLELPVVHIANCVKGVILNSDDAADYPELVDEIEHILKIQYDLANPKIIEYS